MRLWDSGHPRSKLSRNLPMFYFRNQIFQDLRFPRTHCLYRFFPLSCNLLNHYFLQRYLPQWIFGSANTLGVEVDGGDGMFKY